MKRSLMGTVLGLALAGCGGPTNEVFLDGQIYDGAAGTRITSYTINVIYRDKTIKGTVDGNGRFLVQHLPVFQDYTVQVDAAGYRPFRSHNKMFNLPNPDAPSRPEASSGQTFYYDAYLFPSDLQAGAMSLTVRKDSPTGEMVASGKMRLRPISPSVLANDGADTPAAVMGQLWVNDEDLLEKTLDKDIANGMVNFDPGELVYGVHYQVDIYSVDGYQPGTTQVTAGVDASHTLVLNALATDPILVVQTNANACAKPTAPTDTMASVVSFKFNQPIELAMTTLAGGFAEQVDNSFFINWPNTNNNMLQNVLKMNVSSAVQERGTKLTVDTDTFTVSWNPSVGLQTSDPGDVCAYVRWDLSSIQIQPVGKPVGARALSAIYPSASYITCTQ